MKIFWIFFDNRNDFVNGVQMIMGCIEE